MESTSVNKILRLLPMLALNTISSIRDIPFPGHARVFTELLPLVNIINHFYFEGHDSKCLKVQAWIVKQASSVNVFNPLLLCINVEILLAQKYTSVGKIYPYVPSAYHQHYIF